jgi:hypothetical protein
MESGTGNTLIFVIDLLGTRQCLSALINAG